VDFDDVAALMSCGGHQGHHPEPAAAEPQHQRVGVFGCHPRQLAVLRPADRHANLGGGGHGLDVRKYLQQKVEVVHPVSLEPPAPEPGIVHPGVGT
jgi:hypothetical protein